VSKTIVLLVYGDGDYGAMDFEKNFDSNTVYKEMLAEGVTKKTLTYEDDGYYDEIYVSIHEFREVDPKFISFITNEFIDYDYSKAKDFHIIEN